jgi:hypothetical protein
MDIRPIRKSGTPGVQRDIIARGLAPLADDVLLSAAAIVSEGKLEADGDDTVYAGSTMVTIDLPSAVRPDTDRTRLVNQLQRSIGFQLRLMRLARQEAERRSVPLLLGPLEAESSFRLEGDRLLIDIDVFGHARPVAPSLHGMESTLS